MTSVDQSDLLRMAGGGMALVFASQAKAPPILLFWGPAADAPGAGLPPRPFARESQPDTPVPACLSPTGGFGWLGVEGLIVRRGGAPLILSWKEAQTALLDRQTMLCVLRDEALGVEFALTWRLDEASGVVATSARLACLGAEPIAIDWLASVAMPLPAFATEIIAFPGQWAKEQEATRFAMPPGLWAQDNRTGRTGFSGATLVVCAPNTDDFSGPAIACHLGFSGDHRLAVERAPDRPAMMMAGALSPGEVVLRPGETWETPIAYLALSQTGLNGLSDAFHPFVRAKFPAPLPRRVHYNSWEGVYFALDEAILKALATEAAGLGIERFVLDDGWFEGRRNDTKGLGDWRADRDLFPQGLGPLTDHVESLGMDFGLWVEPEMTNPDSAAYRANPDATLHHAGAQRPTMRQQLVWDMADREVRERLFGDLDALLRAHPIKALKWDCNRDAFPAARGDEPRRIRQIEGVYALMHAIKLAHPEVEIEACASGGGRLDLGVAAFTARYWPSDCTDPIERLRIMRWASLVFPLERLGSHVGPSPNPITTRSAPMDFRAKIALFGHLGVELDPRRLDEADKTCLGAHISLYKEHRGLLHSGRLLQWQAANGAAVRLVVAADRGEALLLLAQADMGAAAPVPLHGLDDARRYCLTALSPWPKKAASRLAPDSPWRSSPQMDGQSLRLQGLDLPLVDPLTAWLVHLKAA
jgi:alpha-galactosidase